MESERTTIGSLLRQRAEEGGESPVFLSREAPAMSLGRLIEQMDRIRSQLNAWGIGRTDRIALVSNDVPRAVGVYFGLADTASVAPLNPKLSTHEFRSALERVPFDAIVVDKSLPEIAELVAAEGYRVVLMSAVEGGATGEVELSGLDERECAAPGPVLPDDEGTVQMTTGTTGKPKGAISTQGAMAARAVVQGMSKGCVPEEVGTVFSQPYVSALFNRVTGSLVTGGAMFLANGFDADRLLDDFIDYRIGWIGGGPAFLREIVRAARANPEKASRNSLRVVVSSTTKLPPQVLADVEETLGVPCLEQYASTETGLIAIAPFPPAARKPGKVGLPWQYEIAIHDDEGRPLSANALGRVAVRGENMFSEYYNDPVTTAECFEGEWYYTGDMGFLDDDGYLELVGRKKELINRGGEKISPFEVEEALVSHEAVEDSICFAMSHPTLGQVAAAAVVLKPGATAELDEIRAHIRTRLTPFKVPTPLIVADDIPVGRTKKPNRLGAAEYYGLKSAQESSEPKPDLAATPADGLEAALMGLWANSLGLKTIALDADFITSGGDSLRAEALLLQVEAVTGVSIGIDAMFEDAATIAGMARLIRKKREEKSRTPAATEIVPRRRKFRDILRSGSRAMGIHPILLRMFQPDNHHLLVRKTDFSADENVPPSFDEVLNRIDLFSRAWRGKRVSDRPPVFILNANGRLPPLLWCCNSQSEYNAVVRYVDPDRPVIVIRSIHFVLGSNALRELYYTELVEAYRREIEEQFGSVPNAMGASCGGHPIVERLAHSVIGDGAPPPKIYLLEAELSDPYPGHVTMFFGSKSPIRNPFNAGRDAVPVWKDMHGQVDWQIVEGDHGQTCAGVGTGEALRSVQKALSATAA